MAETVALPPRPPVVVSDTYNLHGLPVHPDPRVSIREWKISIAGEHPILVKEYHTPEGVLRVEVERHADWPWGEHVPFLDDRPVDGRQRRTPEAQAEGRGGGVSNAGLEASAFGGAAGPAPTDRVAAVLEPLGRSPRDYSGKVKVPLAGALPAVRVRLHHQRGGRHRNVRRRA